MKKLKAIIVDDEKSAREGLQSLLMVDPEIELIGSCKDGLEAIDLLTSEDCDVLLLDIQMPAINGFEVLSSIQQDLSVVFITAFDQYAIQAFEHHAIDYLLKPFTNERFYEALGKAKQQALAQKFNRQQLSQLLHQQVDTTKHGQLVQTTPLLDRLVIRTAGKILLLPKEEIYWVEAYDYYIKVHTADKNHLIRESLKGIADRLKAEQFLRIHKSALVNTNKIESIEHLQNAEYMLTLTNGTQVKVSRTYRALLDKQLGLG